MLILKTFSQLKMQKEKLVMMTYIVRLSFNRSWARTNQNARRASYLFFKKVAFNSVRTRIHARKRGNLSVTFSYNVHAKLLFLPIFFCRVSGFVLFVETENYLQRRHS